MRMRAGHSGEWRGHRDNAHPMFALQLANAPAAHQGKLEASSRAKVTSDEDKEIEAMLAQLKA